MKRCVASAFLIGLIGCIPAAFGQNRPAKGAIPSYDQIRQKDQATYDYINQDGTARITVMDTLNLFNYPSGTVTYILNGKPSNNARYVRRLLSRKGTSLESFSISQPDRDGKRTIEINYLSSPE
ncbi:hypothetical protein ACFQ4C_24615 [Larkinella insperata]|uniref:Uncharacterized protein n=1 Tax=Larkinella insperata TaxID=332158 RepID=A0ABW3QJI7_9BACT|nr:hypothetical protein [Larkinella insperata]